MNNKSPKARSKASATKSATVLVRLEPNEKKGFRLAAELAGIDVSAWMRERLRRVARQELEEARLPIPFLQHVLEELRNG